MSRGAGIPAEALLDLRRRLDEDTRAYLDWLLGECAEDGVEVDSLIKPAALDLMAMRLSTPLQFAEHLNRAFDAGFRMGKKAQHRRHRRASPSAASPSWRGTSPSRSPPASREVRFGRHAHRRAVSEAPVRLRRLLLEPSREHPAVAPGRVPVAPDAQREFCREPVEQACDHRRRAHAVVGVAAVMRQEVELLGLDPGPLEPGPHNVADDGSPHAFFSFLDVLCWLRSHRRTLVRS